jgi:hypothetical protein
MSLLNTREAAALLGVQPDTLKLWRHQGRGPRFIKKGDAAQAGVGYEPEDVEAWKAERKFASTSAVTVHVRSTRKHGTCAPLPASA